VSKSFSYLTVLSTDDYLPGVLVLHRSLLEQDVKYPLHVMVTAGVSSECELVLAQHGIGIIRVDKQFNLPPEIQQQNLRSNLSHWNNTLDKLYMFNLVQFDKVVYLDCDMLVLENLDVLFNHPHMSAVVAGKHYPGNQEWNTLNSGLLVFEPQVGLADNIVGILPEVLKTKNVFGDQDLIQEFYSDWPSHDELRLDDKYNIFYNYLPHYIRNLGYKINQPSHDFNIAVIHFAGPVKPWTSPKTFRYYVRRIIYFIANMGLDSQHVWKKYQQLLEIQSNYLSLNTTATGS
jgi:glycogenin